MGLDGVGVENYSPVPSPAARSGEGAGRGHKIGCRFGVPFFIFLFEIR